MSKISIITLHTVNNYGSALQTYATKTILEEMGHEVEFVDYWRANNYGEGAVKHAMESPSFAKYKKICDKLPPVNAMAKKMVRKEIEKRRRPMRQFIEENIPLTHVYLSMEELLSDIPDADIYITGSDQVWNSTWNEGIEKPYFLEYAPEGKPRIAFSASIGKESLDDWEVDQTTDMLKKYNAIGVREQSAVDLLAGLGIDSTLTLDPTLMLTKDQWEKIAATETRDSDYICVYQLNNNPEMDRYIHSLANRFGLKIVRISYGLNKKIDGEEVVCLPKISEFLGLFRDAALIVTDSFHATAFSLGFEKPFISVLPGRFGTRIQSITELTGTTDRILGFYNDYSFMERTIDYDRVRKVLDAERKKTKTFLENALSSCVIH